MARLQHKSPPLTASVQFFLADRKAQGFTAKTQEYYRDTMSRFLACRESEGHARVTDMTPGVMRTSLYVQSDRGFSR